MTAKPTPQKMAEYNARWREKHGHRLVACPDCLCEMREDSYPKHATIPHTERCEDCGALCTPPDGRGRARDIVWHRRELHGDDTTHAGLSLEARAMSRGWTSAERAAICDDAIALMRERDQIMAASDGGWVR